MLASWLGHKLWKTRKIRLDKFVPRDLVICRKNAGQHGRRNLCFGGLSVPKHVASTTMEKTERRRIESGH